MDIPQEADTVVRYQQAAAYARRSRVLFFIGLALKVAGALALLGSGLSIWWRTQIESLTANPLLVVGLYTSTLAGAYGLLRLPLQIYQGLILPRRYGLLTQTTRMWTSELLQGLPLVGLWQLIQIEGLYLFLRWLPGAWWILAGGAMVVLTIIAVWLLPLVISPLVNTFTPLPDGDLRTRLLDLIRRSGATIQSLVVEDSSRRTTTANAYVIGIGGAERIVLGDTLVNTYTPDEIETVMGHELHHYIHQDIWRKVTLNSAVIMINFLVASVAVRAAIPAFGLRDVADVAGLPVFSLVSTIVGLLFQPLTNGYSRHLERAADRYALHLTNKPSAFIGAMRKLEYQNLAEHDPPNWEVFLFYSHPPIPQRIRAAAHYAGTLGLHAEPGQPLA